MLHALRDNPNVIRLRDVLKNPSANVYTIVTDYHPHGDFDVYRAQFTLPALRAYFKELLTTLDVAHSRGIVLRDVKPQNILYDFESSKMKLIDFGLAEFYQPEANMSPRVASRFFKAPELLLDSEYYNYSVDVWAAGVVFASIVSLADFRQVPVLFRCGQQGPADQDRGGAGFGRAPAVPAELQERQPRPVQGSLSSLPA